MTDGKPVLRPDPYDGAWNEFCDALGTAITTAGCMGTHYFAERLLEARGLDAEASLALFERRGGYCDCEILLNVDLGSPAA